MHIVNEIWAFFREGFQHVNAVQGLIIALVAAFLMPRWRRLVPIALGATLVHLIADVLIPVIARHAAFHLPPLLTLSYWRLAGTLFLGYLVVIAVFFLIRQMLLGSRH